MARWATHRTDIGAKELIAYAKKQGAQYLALGGELDGVLRVGTCQRLVDWKSKGGTLTPRQAKLVAEGWDISFISTVEQLEYLLFSMKQSSVAR